MIYQAFSILVRSDKGFKFIFSYSIQCARSSEYQLDKYELIEKHGQFFIYKNKANPLNFRVTYSKTGNCIIHLVF